MIKKPSSRVFPQTREILSELLGEAKRVADTRSTDRGFMVRLAKKYGVTRGRISNIARDYGLTDAARSAAARAARARRTKKNNANRRSH